MVGLSSGRRRRPKKTPGRSGYECEIPRPEMQKDTRYQYHKYYKFLTTSRRKSDMTRKPLGPQQRDLALKRASLFAENLVRLSELLDAGAGTLSVSE